MQVLHVPSNFRNKIKIKMIPFAFSFFKFKTDSSSPSVFKIAPQVKSDDQTPSAGSPDIYETV